jgi:hypothetical protein
MPKNRKTKSKPTKSKTATGKRAKKSSGVKQARRPAKTVKKKPSKNRASLRTSLPGKRKAPRSDAQRMESSQNTENAVPSRQSIDFQGLSRAQQADSESVEELVEEGNVVEAGAVAGVEEADDEDAREVHTHEVPEDDVPDEYLDKD